MAEQEGQKTIRSIRTSTVFGKFCRPFVSKLTRSSFMGRRNVTRRFLSIYLRKFDEKSQNYLSIKVHVKWSLREFGRFIA